jgi:hypothetical protein
MLMDQAISQQLHQLDDDFATMNIDAGAGNV